ncbi:GtrA family protein [Streptomyces olivochromogenes]|uniref:GtrA family protein n=1 Tax=Streptomyces olivochromogenes TaxID=1963 RepID=UPI001F15A73D|nr:GtrA family protein [Streptomyces olivochromogenes]MCF3132590.1 GtrA family protein [Streptomyces olivochromogenes]
MPNLTEPATASDVPEAGFARQLPVFAIIGLVSTAAYLGLYVALRPVLDAQPANLVALLVTAVANTAANRRFTFRVRGAEGAARHQLQGLVAFFAGLALSGGALAVVHRTLPDAPEVEVGALIVANAAATALRFVLLRLWVFRGP